MDADRKLKIDCGLETIYRKMELSEVMLEEKTYNITEITPKFK